ncbi:MAG: DUF2147 domain-containing protein [Flavobacterium sp.]|nr:DUF2147 domain-containing protein [Flavobacterium sp.]
MKNILVIAFILISQLVASQSVTGKWKTVDDETGVEKSVVEIVEKNGKISAKIIEIFEVQYRSRKCDLCTGDDKDKPILGFTIIKGLTKDGKEYNGGKITDPKNGKSYKCYITLESKDKLKVRGYIGFALIGRTQYWTRVK